MNEVKTRKSPRLFLIGGFEVRLGVQPVPILTAGERIVALLAMSERAVSRSYVAGVLWPETSASRANANLRSTLWRLRRQCPSLLDISTHRLRLTPDIEVDVRRVARLARSLIEPPEADEERTAGLDATVRRELSGDLLPDWSEDWVLIERERFRQMRLHALEMLATRLIELGRYGEAVDAGMAAVSGEPLRESAQRTLIRAFLAEGNGTEAVRQYEEYERMLHRELAMRPSEELRSLLTDALGVRTSDGLTGVVVAGTGAGEPRRRPPRRRAPAGPR